MRRVAIVPAASSKTCYPVFGCAISVIMNCSDRKSTRLNSSHLVISYAVFCLKKKKVVDALVAGRDGRAQTTLLRPRPAAQLHRAPEQALDTVCHAVELVCGPAAYV